ncbi:MAG TPA: two-component sensor histidine kinase, partial [Beijerinckiaceae bacterium]
MRGLKAPLALTGWLAPASAMAQSAGPLSIERMHASQGVIAVSVFVALVLFSSTTALLHLNSRRKWTQRERQLAGELAAARDALDRANVFLSAEPQIVVAWGSVS